MSDIKTFKDNTLLIENAYKDKFIEINGNKYEFSNVIHMQRRKVFAYLTKIAKEIESNAFTFLETKEWVEIETLLNGITLVDGQSISKIPGYWDKYADDYITFIFIALQVISYPFMKGAVSIN